MNTISKKTQDFLHFFHRPFGRVLTQEQFRYLSCGAFVAILDVMMFSFVYNILLHRQPLHLGGMNVQSHVAALWIPFPVGFLISYLLSRYVVFHQTTLKSTTSVFRYTLLVVACQVLNYLLIKFFVEVCVFPAIVSKILCTVLVALFSYVAQRYFTFKT